MCGISGILALNHKKISEEEINNMNDKIFHRGPDSSGIFIEDNIAIWMGSVTLTSKNGDILKVDKSLAYKKLSNGNLKIVLHHSSLPYEKN